VGAERSDRLKVNFYWFKSLLYRVWVGKSACGVAAEHANQFAGSVSGRMFLQIIDFIYLCLDLGASSLA